MNKKQIQKFCKDFEQELKSYFPIKIAFNVKVKKIKSGFLGVYRAGTATKSRSACIWIDEDIFNRAENAGVEHKIETILRDTICHELVHVFQEILAFKKNPNLSLSQLRFDEDEAEQVGVWISDKPSRIAKIDPFKSVFKILQDSK